MATTVGAPAALELARQRYLEAHARELATTLRVLRAYPPDRLDLRPHPRAKDARELAWVFALEGWFGVKVYNGEYRLEPGGPPPPPPAAWDELLAAVERAQNEFAELVRGTPAAELERTVPMAVAPRTLGEVRRLDWAWTLLYDQIHHRGQFSVYLRMAGGKVPSIYGPSADEPWT